MIANAGHSPDRHAADALVDEEHLALMSCQHALSMGRAAGRNVARDLLGLTHGSASERGSLPIVPISAKRPATVSGSMRGFVRTLISSQFFSGRAA